MVYFSDDAQPTYAPEVLQGVCLGCGEMSQKRAHRCGSGWSVKVGKSAGELMRERRGALGWPLSRLAAAAGVSKGFVSLVELGRREASEKGLARGEEALGIGAGELVRAARLGTIARWHSLDEAYRSGELRKMVEGRESPAACRESGELLPLQGPLIDRK